MSETSISKYILFLTFAHFEPNTVIGSHHRTPKYYRTFIARFLFRYSVLFELNAPIESHLRTSHHKPANLNRFLFTAFTHVESKIDWLPLTVVIKRDIANEHWLRYLHLPLLFISNLTFSRILIVEYPVSNVRP